LLFVCYFWTISIQKKTQQSCGMWDEGYVQQLWYHPRLLVGSSLTGEVKSDRQGELENRWIDCVWGAGLEVKPWVVPEIRIDDWQGEEGRSMILFVPRVGRKRVSSVHEPNKLVQRVVGNNKGCRETNKNWLGEEIQSQRQHPAPLTQVKDRKNAHNNECMRVLERDQVDSQGYDAGGDEREERRRFEAEWLNRRESVQGSTLFAQRTKCGKSVNFWVTTPKCINNVPYVRARKE
jgi:hypothetical protein